MQEMTDEYSHMKEISSGMLDLLRKITMNLSHDDAAQRKLVQKWAIQEINGFNEDLGRFLSIDDLNNPDLSRNAGKHRQYETHSNDKYSDKLETGDKDIGRSTIPAGSRKMVKIETEQLKQTPKERIKAKWNPFTNSYENKEKIVNEGDEVELNCDRDVEIVHEISRSAHNPTSHEMYPKLEDIEESKHEITQPNEDTYEEDFEDYMSEKKGDTQKFGQVTEFSLAKLNYTKIRDDLSDFSLLLLKNTNATQEMNKEGILEKRT